MLWELVFSPEENSPLHYKSLDPDIPTTSWNKLPHKNSFLPNYSLSAFEKETSISLRELEWLNGKNKCLWWTLKLVILTTQGIFLALPFYSFSFLFLLFTFFHRNELQRRIKVMSNFKIFFTLTKCVIFLYSLFVSCISSAASECKATSPQLYHDDWVCGIASSCSLTIDNNDIF